MAVNVIYDKNAPLEPIYFSPNSRRALSISAADRTCQQLESFERCVNLAERNLDFDDS